MAEYMPESARPPRAFGELRYTGLLWLINRVVFHPRGYALSLCLDRAANGEPATGWRLLGDGREPWRFEGDEDEKFAAVAAFLAQHTAPEDGDA